jgi:CheY-like chemotaxis protein
MNMGPSARIHVRTEPGHSSPPNPRRLRLALLNDNASFLQMLCDWFTQHGHDCVTAVVADLPNAHQDVPRFINEHEPDVVVYEVGTPYASSWDLLDVIRCDPSLKTQAFVVTTPSKKKLEEAVGETSALELAGPTDLPRILQAVEAVSHTACDA